MERSEKQRNFVYLRQLADGRESGYARAETQDRMVGLHIAVQGFVPLEDAYAFAVTDDGVVLLGKLMLDTRGQGGASAKVSRQDYRAMQVLFVLRETQDGAQIPLAGTPGRSGRVDWEWVKSLAQRALHPRQYQEEEKTLPAQELPTQESEVTLREIPKRVEIPQEVQQTAADLPQETTAEPELPHADEEALYDLAAQDAPYKDVERELRTPFVPERRVEMPMLLRNAYWPQHLWPVHDLFERFEETFPFGREADCAYIRIPLDGKYGTVAYYLMGAKVKDGWVTAIGYLIPGTADKNVGIAGSVFSDGYWQSWQAADPE